MTTATTSPISTRDLLHRLADMLPDAELDTAARVLQALAGGVLDPAMRTALLAPDDDEPVTEEELTGMAESRADIAAGRVHTAAEVRASLGLE